MKTHPEQRPNEEYLGNRNNPFKDWQKPFKTLRLGNATYDINGKLFTGTNYRPVFIGKSEYGRYNRAWKEVIDRIRRS
jgi:hypothetical protein